MCNRLHIKLCALPTVAFIFHAEWQSERLGKILLMKALDMAIAVKPSIKTRHKQAIDFGADIDKVTAVT